jgi:hypothetical protein
MIWDELRAKYDRGIAMKKYWGRIKVNGIWGGWKSIQAETGCDAYAKFAKGTSSAKYESLEISITEPVEHTVK